MNRADWAAYLRLRDRIADAIAVAIPNYHDGDELSVFISPDLDEVEAGLGAWWDDRDDETIPEDWYKENVASLEDAVNLADKYFDLR